MFPRLAPYPFGGTVGYALSGDQTMNVFRAPCTGEIVYLAVGRGGLAATTINTTNYFNLIVYDAGAAGTGTAVIASRGGKSTSWTANQRYELITEGATPHKLDKGDCVTLKHDESGAVTTTPFIVGSFVPGLQD